MMLHDESLTRPLPGSKQARIVLQCGHKILTGKTMRLIGIKRGEQRLCPEGCGSQGVKQVESTIW